MDWNAAAAVGELVGGAGVILSILYLAQQVRASSAATARSGSHDAVATTVTWLLTVAADPGLNDIWQRGLASPESLTESERSRVRVLLTALMMIWEEGHHWKLGGHIAKWNQHLFEFGHRRIVPTPGYRKLFWDDRSDFLTPELRSVLEPLLSAPPQPGPKTDSA